MAMDRLIDDFCYDATKIRGVTDLTIKTYKYSLNAFEKFIKTRNINLISVDKNAIRDYIGSLREGGRRTKTITNHLAAIASFYEYLVYEEIIVINPVNAVRKRYAAPYKNDGERQTHKLVSLTDAGRLVNSAVDIRDRALILLLLKTGIRKRELVSIDLEDINWHNQSILLKPKKKRTNRVVFYDNEMSEVLIRWVAARENRNRRKSNALFITPQGRISPPAVDYIIRQAALRAGLHDIESPRMEDHFSAHCCRHWFTTHLRRAGMSREFIQELRGDARREAIDIYDHIDHKELKESYLAHIPQLGI
jgi:integrase/recombinase XerD